MPSRRSFIVSVAASPLFGHETGHQPGAGTAIVLHLPDRKILHLENPDFASRALLPPASTIKPFALQALFDAGKLRPNDEFQCSRLLTINGHSLHCIHPVTAIPMNPIRALAYSCNGAVAHFAQRFAPDELAQAYVRNGFASLTGLLPAAEAAGLVQPKTFGPACQLQALGEEGIAITPLELLLAYARLAHRASAPVLEGLEGAVEFGTAQAAQVPGTKVAGKTGSILLRSGTPAAWFAGFAPSRHPRLAVVVLTPGHSGGLDAAPIAGGLLKRAL